MDNGEDRLMGKQDSWLGNGEGKLELAGWHHLMQEPCLEENEEDGFKRASDMRHHVYQVKSGAVLCGESCNIWFVLHDILID